MNRTASRYTRRLVGGSPLCCRLLRWALPGLNGPAQDTAVRSDGKLVVAGRRGNSNIVDSVGTVDRFNHDGSFDKS